MQMNSMQRAMKLSPNILRVALVIILNFGILVGIKLQQKQELTPEKAEKQTYALPMGPLSQYIAQMYAK